MSRIKRVHCLIALLAIVTMNVFAQTKATLIEKVEANGNNLNIPYEKWKLPNGLIVLIHEDHSDPIAHVNVTYHVGSAREDIGRSGFAHFFEHMMFQGSDNVKDEEHFKIISEAGGDMNGYTQNDLTVYYQTIPSNYVETALWLEADRMGFLLDSVTQRKFEIQRSAVKNEKGQRMENQPYGMVGELLPQTLYPAGHPYSWPVIGYVDDLNRASLTDLKNFFLRWYGPNNAILTIAGDVNPQSVIAMVEKYFGSINPGPEVKKLKPQVPILPTNQYASYADNIVFPLTIMSFPTVQKYHRDEPALDILADVMGGSNNSIFYQKFVKTEKAVQAGTSHGSNEISGEFQVFLLPYPEDFFDMEKHFKETEDQIRATINEFEKEGITEEAIQRAKAKMEASVIDAVTSINGKATLISQWQTFLGRPYNLSDEIERYNKVTKEDVQRVYTKYIKGKNAAIVNVYPKMPGSKDSVKSVNPYANVKVTDNPDLAGLVYKKPVDNFDRSKRPSPAQPKAPVIPEYYTHELKNGIKIIGTKTSETPKVVIEMEIDGGALVLNDPNKIDVPQLTASIMGEGTQTLTTEQLSAELEKLGSSISFSGGKTSTTVYVESLVKNLDATLKLFEDVLLKPRFDEADFKRIKKQYVENLENEKTVPDVTASKIFNNIIFGDNVLGAYSTKKNAEKVTLEEVKNYYNQYYSPTVTKMVIVGDVDKSQILPKLEFLNKWQAKEVKIPQITATPKFTGTQIFIVHKDFAKQSVIRAGMPGLKYDATGEYFKASIMNYPFGGAFNSRLNLNLREDKGYTYGIRGGFSGSRYGGSYTISSGVRASATDSSVAEIMKEVKKFRTSGITDEELSFTKNSLLNSDALNYETPYQKSSFLSQIITYNLSKDFTAEQAKILNSMTKEEANMLAQKYIDPNKMAIVVVGNKYQIKKQLEKLKLGTVSEVSLEEKIKRPY